MRAIGGVDGTDSPEGEVVLGVDTHLECERGRSPGPAGQTPGRVERCRPRRGDTRGLLRWAAGFGPVRMRRDRGYQQLRSRTRPPPKGRRDLGDGGRAAQAPPSQAQRQIRPHRRGGSSEGGAGRRGGRGEPKSADGQGGDDPGLAIGPPLGGEGQKPGRQPASGPTGHGAGGPEGTAYADPLPRSSSATCARFRLGDDPEDVRTATRFALRSLARRHVALSEEIAELDAQMDRLVAEVAPELISRPAIGTHHAATLLVLAGDNPQRLDTEASFASLCGVSPIEGFVGEGGEASA